jgi:hypothetical protein
VVNFHPSREWDPPASRRLDRSSPLVVTKRAVEIVEGTLIFMDATLEEARNFLATVSGENIRAAGDYRLFRRHDPRGGLEEAG